MSGQSSLYFPKVKVTDVSLPLLKATKVTTVYLTHLSKLISSLGPAQGQLGHHTKRNGQRM